MRGFDDHLDNYGNPGLNMESESRFGWVLTEPVDIRLREDETFLISSVDDHKKQIIISFERTTRGETMLINGENIDLQDDYIAFISLLDDYYEHAGNEYNKTVRSDPSNVNYGEG